MSMISAYSSIFSRGIRDKLRHLDILLLGFISALLVLGEMLLISAGDTAYEFALKQIIAFAIFSPLYIVIIFSDVKVIYRNAYFIYLICLLLLIVAEIFGHKAMGAQRWIRIGPINFQPSELMKIGLILALARYFHDLPASMVGNIRHLLIPTLILLSPIALVLRQPNLGTATILLFIGASIFFISGVRIWKFISIAMIALMSLPVIWSNMHGYQKKRVLTFLNPEEDKLGAGYNILQSMIAIGSGNIIGHGWQSGPQSQLHFLPEKHTDFIFTILAEEFGFIGVVCTLGLCSIIYFYILAQALSVKNQFSRLVMTGVAIMFLVHIFINTAMISGLIPVVGVPFPLLSYGGSNQMCILIGFSLVLCSICSRHAHIN